MFSPIEDHHDPMKKIASIFGNIEIIQTDGTPLVGHILNKPVYVNLEFSANKIVFCD